jgi:hypothetical protein
MCKAEFINRKTGSHKVAFLLKKIKKSLLIKVDQQAFSNLDVF